MVNSSKWDIHVILCFGIYTTVSVDIPSSDFELSGTKLPAFTQTVSWCLKLEY